MKKNVTVIANDGNVTLKIVAQINTNGSFPFSRDDVKEIAASVARELMSAITHVRRTDFGADNSRCKL